MSKPIDKQNIEHNKLPNTQDQVPDAQPSALSSPLSAQTDVLVKVENLGKKFCRDLKTSLWYGVKDLSSEFFGRQRSEELRPKEFWAVNDISFELRRGECLGLIGHNGAGKSTLLKMLNGLIKPDKGTITMKGRIGALIELGAGFNPVLTGRENIYINGQVLGFSKKEINEKFDAIVDFAEIGEFIDSPVKNYSSGMKVRLGFAVASQMEPDVLLIDEVLAVGDLGFRLKCMNVISQILRNTAIIFVSHSMPLISRICTKGLLLDKGGVTLETNNISDLIQNYSILFKPHNSLKVFGNTESEISNMRVNESIIKENGDPIIISQNEELKIQFEYSIPRQIQLYSVHIIVSDMEMKHVAITTCLDQYGPLENQTCNNKATVSIPNHFSAGKYSIGITMIENLVVNNNILIGETLVKYDNLFTIIVSKASLVTSVPIQIKSNWMFSGKKV